MGKINWIKFFRSITDHRAGFYASLPYEVATNIAYEREMAARLFMVPPPKGHPIGLTEQALEWIRSEATS